MKKFNRYKNCSYKQGIYKPVNCAKYIGKGTPQYRSSWELKFFQWCDKNPNILEWSSETIIVPYKSPIDNRYHRYYVDNAIVLKEGHSIIKYLVEIKPYKQTLPPVASKRKKRSTVLYENRTYAVNQAKWEAADKFANVKDMKFIILTENELNIK